MLSGHLGAVVGLNPLHEALAEIMPEGPSLGMFSSTAIKGARLLSCLVLA